MKRTPLAGAPVRSVAAYCAVPVLYSKVFPSTSAGSTASATLVAVRLLNAVAERVTRRAEAARLADTGAVDWIAPSDALTIGAPKTPSMPPAAQPRLAMAGELKVAETAFMSLLVPSALKVALSLLSPHAASTRAEVAASQSRRTCE